MIDSHIARRDAAAARHDAALAKFPTREGNAFSRELAGVIEELKKICAEAERVPVDKVDLAKTYRWLGDAYFDKGRAKDEADLVLGAAAYDRAHVLLENEDAPVERAKLAFNFGNTLRGLSKGTDAGLLEAAQDRYESALATFRAHRLRDLEKMAGDQLASLRPMLVAVRGLTKATDGERKLREILEQARKADVAEQRRLLDQAYQVVAESGSPGAAEALQKATEVLAGQAAAHPERLPKGADLAALRREVDALAGRLSTLMMQSGPDPGDRMFATMLQVLVAEFQKRVAAGEIASVRVQQLNEILDRAKEIIAMPGEDVGQLERRLAAMREVMQVVNDLIGIPSLPAGSKPEDAASRALLEILAGVRSRVVAEKFTRLLPPGESQAATRLVMRAMQAEARVRQFAGDESARATIADEVWRIATDTQAYARRRHLMLVRPLFRNVRIADAPRSAFASGGPVLKAAMKILHRRKELAVLAAPASAEFAQERWNQLRAGAVAFFDLGVETPSELAQVCYELGLALCLGKPIVVATRAGRPLPFDVVLEPVILGDDAEENAGLLLAAVHHALAAPQWGGTEAIEGGALSALERLRQWTGKRSVSGIVAPQMKRAAAAADDAVEFRDALDSILGLLDADAPLAVLPAWPAAYADPQQKPRCFHVMPFAPAWANATRELARNVCVSNGWDYVRGDEADEQRIIRAIWNEISSATVVLVDLTGLNPNVALELGAAHGFGARVRIVMQGEVKGAVLPGIAKIQVHGYEARPPYEGFASAVEGLLRA